MSTQSWYDRRNDRQRRYAGRVMSANQTILIEIDDRYAERYDGQVAALVAANLFPRMTPALAFDVSSSKIVEPLPWAGRELAEVMLSLARGVDPHADFQIRKAREGDIRIRLGKDSAPFVIHGSGWNAYNAAGSASPLTDVDDANPAGPAFAVVAGAAHLFARMFAPADTNPLIFNTLRWNDSIERNGPPLVMPADLGSLWTVGAGSVGTAALYFLTLATRNFSSLAFDMDVVKVENLDRSPIFVDSDAEELRNKATVTNAYLRSIGVTNSEAEPYSLDQSARWMNRRPGEPDLVIAAANERNVRYVIEQSSPPLQIYGATGSNWGASVIRHVPTIGGCSCCIFPPDMEKATMRCAEGQVLPPDSGEKVDAALPFLSFAAGLMTAIEILKLNLKGFPFSPERTMFTTGPGTTPRFVSLNTPQRVRCVCVDRSERVHRRMIEGTKYAWLSSEA